MSILTLNCNGIRDQSKRIGLVQWFRNLPVSADVVCLQETHVSSVSECSSWFSSSGFNAVASPGSVHSCGCVILYRPSLSLNHSWCDDADRYLQREFSFLGKVFRVVCLYAPKRNHARDDFFFIPALIPRSQLIWLSTSMRSLTGLSTVAVLTTLAYPVRAPLHSVTYSNRAA